MGEMHAKSDAELLRDYAERGDESAFREIVHRHANLVYAAACRQMNSPDLAHDVAQEVFTDLARKASSLAKSLTTGASLLGWLYRGTRFASLNHLRDDRRRQSRERQAMQDLDSPTDSTIEWDRVCPVLDEAMSDLDDEDRDALLLRFFKNHNFRTIGAEIGVSDDAAQKRVSRALERLRAEFNRRGVTTTAIALSTALSVNAAPVAPIGLATTLSTAALAGTTLATATQAIAMTTFQKAIIGATIAVAVGTGIYTAREASNLRDQARALQQLQRDRDEATRQFATLRDENERLNRNTAELLKLRGEVARLKSDARASTQAEPVVASMDSAAKSWLNRVDQLKRYIELNPKVGIPEFQFLTDREWLVVADAGLETEKFQKESEYDHAMQSLRIQAEMRFGQLVGSALRKYSATNGDKFPNNLSQLESYCEPTIWEILREHYEIKPASILPEGVRQNIPVKFDWFVTRKQRVNSNSTSRLAILNWGNAYWQSPS